MWPKDKIGDFGLPVEPDRKGSRFVTFLCTQERHKAKRWLGCCPLPELALLRGLVGPSERAGRTMACPMLGL
eukprot:COSAG04_NODE_7151_length_1179_cov_17.262037_2_plen_72_part_00